MNEKLSPVDVSTLQERVYAKLREAIFQGVFAPGETITIRSLAGTLGTSAMPVREALQRLVAEKALVQLPTRSINVAPFSPETFDELVRIRMANEGLATRRAAMIGGPKLVAELRSINRRMQSAIKSGDSQAALDANKALHFTIYEAAEMPHLLDVINGLWLRTGPYLGLAYRQVSGGPRHFDTGTRIHERVIDAFDKRDPQAAARGLCFDIWCSARRFRPALIELFAEKSVDAEDVTSARSVSRAVKKLKL